MCCTVVGPLDGNARLVTVCTVLVSKNNFNYFFRVPMHPIKE